jgi:V/A-type H+-transporting ATPase subunit I
MGRRIDYEEPVMFTEKMRKIVAVILQQDVDKVTQELLRLGVLHMINITEVDPQLSNQVERISSPVTEANIVELRKRVDSFLDMIGEADHTHQELDIKDLKTLNLAEITKFLDGIADSLQSVREEQQEIQQQIMKIDDIRRQLVLFGDLGAGLQARSQNSFLNLQTGSVRPSVLESLREALQNTPSVLLTVKQEKEQATLLLISMKRDESAINEILTRFSWIDVELTHENMTGDAGAIGELDGKLTALREKQEKLSQQGFELLQEKRSDLHAQWENLRLNELCAKLRASYSCTSRTVIISGWIRADDDKELEDEIRRATENRYYLERYEPTDMPAHQKEQIPVQLRHSPWLRPFQMLIKNYSLPEYGTVDPTPFVTVSYLVMFGLMFGDVGHGAVLLLLGLIGMSVCKKKDENLLDLTRLIAWCGGSAILSGILFGSYFGMQWLRPIWFDYHGIVTGHAHSGSVRTIYDILRITIYFGIIVLGMGLLLNWINLIIKRRWFKIIFDKGGVIGAWIYGAGIYVSFYFVEHNYKEFPNVDLLVLIFGIPSIILGLKPILHFAMHRDGKPLGFSTVLGILIEWMVELLEIFAGYLANTLSFMRVAGLGIAHVCLMIALAAMADMLKDAAGSYTLSSYLLFIIGHGIIIALEGLSAGIQSLRLNYYEFFSKYFSGSGRAYSPVSLRSSL